ncbi:unnamed protein product [Parajaminaea phylloscopi]
MAVLTDKEEESSSARGQGTAAAATVAPLTSVRSRSQLARRQSYTSRKHRIGSSRFGHTASEKPAVGGLTVLDIVFIAVSYGLNLLKTLGLAELLDIVLKGFYYCIASLPFDFYRRWSLSHPRPPKSTRSAAPRTARRRGAEPAQSSRIEEDDSNSDSDPPDGPSAESRYQDSTGATTGQISPFHHLVILLTRFACTNFPHLLPRVLFAEETMLPFVGWRTGGASWGLIRPFTGPKGAADFRAVWLGEDAFMSQDIRRSNKAAQQATTVLYLHGGGFSLGSVSFYSEALLRILNKVATLETQRDSSKSAVAPRCVAVEYELSPVARFPSPLLQCLRCYASLIEDEKLDPQHIVFAGDSAGGNLAMAMLLALSGQAQHEKGLQERDWSQLPLPGKALLISPWVDLRPKQAKAFAPLRIGTASGPPKSKPASNRELRDSMASYDWDYVASESLLHFAQVYAGVLHSPRRVAGPVGWISHLCGVLGQGLQAERREKKSSSRRHSRRAEPRVTDPARRLARAVSEALERPMFDALSGATREKATSGQVVPSTRGYTAALRPLFSPQERRTDKVATSQQLFEPFEGQGVSDITEAEHNLDCNPLMSPALGDWTKVRLKHGALVTWGQRERLSSDIRDWADAVHSGRSPAERLQPAADDDLPCQDGQKEQELAERQERGAWLKTCVEEGPAGVHAWPFVSMYLAGTEEEREKGLNLLAEFIVKRARDDRPAGSVSHTNTALPSRSDLQRNSSPDPFVPWTESAHMVQRESGAGPSDLRLITKDSDELEDSFDGGSSLSSSPSLDFFSGRARSAAAGRRFTSEEYQEALGLGVTLSGEHIARVPSTAASDQLHRDGEVRLAGSSAEQNATTSRPRAVASRIDRNKASTPTRGRQLGDSRPLWWSDVAATQAASSAALLDTPPQQMTDNMDTASSRTTSRSADVPELPRSTTSEAARAEAEMESLVAPAELDPAFYGLSFSSKRDEEGLSDIAEESSVLSGSVTSAQGTTGPPHGAWPAEGDVDESSELVLSPATHRSILDEAQRQLEEEQDDGDDDDDDDDGDDDGEAAEWALPENDTNAAGDATRASSSRRKTQDVWWA